MSEEIQLDSLLISLKRIFALPISKTTFKQVQNAVFTSITDPEERKAIFEALLTATFKEEPSEKHKRHVKKALLEEFSVPVRVAKEVEERGDLLLFITSDIVQQPHLRILLNRAKRIDGEEFLFFSDTETTLHLIEHFVKRMKELIQNDEQTTTRFKKNFETIKATFDEFLS